MAGACMHVVCIPLRQLLLECSTGVPPLVIPWHDVLLVWLGRPSLANSRGAKGKTCLFPSAPPPFARDGLASQTVCPAHDGYDRWWPWCHAITFSSTFFFSPAILQSESSTNKSEFCTVTKIWTPWLVCTMLWSSLMNTTQHSAHCTKSYSWIYSWTSSGH